MTVVLDALDARNPVAFLAALGALRLATDSAGAEVRLHWHRHDGNWSPVCDSDAIADGDALVDAIVRGHEARDLDRELGWERDILKLSREDVRRLIEERLRGGQPWSAAAVAACVAELPERRNGWAPYTPLRLIPRMGRARFLETARKLSGSRTVEEDLRAALFGSWRYSKGNNLAWDPGATLPVRAYAAEAPTHFGPLAVPGAMLLAVAALPLFPLMGTRRTGACRGFGRDGRRLTWPVWTSPMTLQAVRCLLGLPALYRPEPDLRVLARHGVAIRLSAPRARFGSDGWVLGWGEPVVTGDARPD
jgi:CRISPR-associated endonuclease/helicase Cas3